MSNSFNGKDRFNLESVDRWRADPEGNGRKFEKTQSSVRRQRVHGATVDDVRAKVLRLHRMSTAFDGNGSTHKLRQSMLPPRPQFTPQPRTRQDSYSSHPETDLPTAKEARAEMDALRGERLEARGRNRPSTQREMHDAEDRLDELLAELENRYRATLDA